MVTFTFVSGGYKLDTMSITLTNIDSQTNSWLEQEAQRYGIAPDELIMRLLQTAMQQSTTVETKQRHHDLDHLAGTWSADEAEAFLATLADFSQIDEALWA